MNNPEKFARVTFNLFRQEGRFQISLSPGLEIDPLVHEFQSLGCGVTIDRQNMYLIVTCASE
jgi:hypothetical protein